jgi:hypothetical protein
MIVSVQQLGQFCAETVPIRELYISFKEGSDKEQEDADEA